ncbi:MAG: 30S ribosomal protein S18 [Actinomycetia bacterium]|nr:30S ribosomal protein S18 [Actinomycetes bacterium]
MGKSTKRGPKVKDQGRKFKKKTSILDSEQIDYVDWKDVDLLRRFMSDRAKIRARRVNGNSEQQQREVSNAIKNAREMALLPYSSRVTTQRGGRGDRRGRRDRPPRDDDRPPRDDDRRPRREAPADEDRGDAPAAAPAADSPAASEEGAQ